MTEAIDWKRVHHESLVVDTHQDLPYRLWLDWEDVGVRTARGHLDLPRMREGGLDCAFMSIYVPAEYAGPGAARVALELMDIAARIAEAHPGAATLAASVAEIRAAAAAGRIALVYGVEGGHAIEDSLGVLRQLYRAGARYLTLTHTNTNNWADSCGNYYSPSFDPQKLRVHGGLTPFGRDVVREMNRLGMMVDISHVSDETFWNVLEVSTAPVFASHSSARALCDVPRNLADDMMRALADRGGVCMVNFGAAFLAREVADAARQRATALRPAIAEVERQHAGDFKEIDRRIDALFDANPLPRTTLAHLADHIAHAAGVMGWDHVGLGSDFDGVRDLPEGMRDVTMLPALAGELGARGASPADVRGVLGENFLRFMTRVEAAAVR